MLKTLHVKNLAIVEELLFEPRQGFTILSGETGAGKSIIVNSLHLLLGGRAGADHVRDGAQSASIESLWELPASHPALKVLDAFDIHVESEILIKRTISKEGKSRFSVNGSPATASMLKKLADSLMNISGQHEHIALLNPDSHLEHLDSFAALKPLLDKTKKSFTEFRTLESKLAALTSDESKRLERLDFIKFQLDEMKKIAPVQGEEESLSEERERLRNIGKLSEAASNTMVSLTGEESENALDIIGASLATLERAAKHDPKLSEIFELVSQSQSVLNDAAFELGNYLESLSTEPGRLEEVEARLFELSRLFRKFGGGFEAMKEKRRELETELRDIDFDEESLVRLQNEVKALEKKYLTDAKELHKKRVKASKKLVDAVGSELKELGFIENAFRLDISECEPSEMGIDKVEFIFAPNPGEAPKPLVKIASGGELSRFLLGIKIVLASVDPVASYVFDEVDSGVGGATAEKIGLRLKKLSTDKQVLCITHLAPIAGFAEHHYLIKKQVRNGRTFSILEKLSAAEREEEIARMLSGAPESKAARQHAREILKSKKTKK